MKSSFYTLVFVVVLSGYSSCKNQPDNKAVLNTPEPSATSSSTPSAQSSQPKTYTVTFTPDSVRIGKSNELKIQVKNAKAIELQTPDGKGEGTELTFDLDVTNTLAMGGSALVFSTNDCRLVLDNGNSITQKSGDSKGIQPESTESLHDITFDVPADATAKSFTFFYNDTRVSTALTITN